jgi:hypothetical protein
MLQLTEVSKTQVPDQAPLLRPRRVLLLLLVLTFAALLLHGYHPRAEDAEIYVSSIVHLLHPSYYPFGREFFETNAKLMLFPNLVAWSVRISHLPLDWVLFLWQLASIFLLLLGCWKLSSKCFPTPAGRWAAVSLVAALLTLPIASTSLYILDQYFNPRSLFAFAIVFAIDAMVSKKYWQTALWVILIALMQPFMAVFGISYLVLLYLFGKKQTSPMPILPAVLIPALLVRDPSPAYMKTLTGHPNLFLFRWPWYSWLGVLGPLVLLAWFERIARIKQRPAMRQLAGSMILFGLIYLAGAAVIGIPQSLITLNRFEPMRSFYLVYLLLILLGGGLLGEMVLKAKTLRWLLLFVPLCLGMGYAQFQLFPADRHVEWPGAAPENPWVQAFVWIKKHTPTEAIFALPPRYESLPNEDHQGFRAIAERSRLADAGKDSSVATLYPNLPLAQECYAQTQAVKGWKHFTPRDFDRLKRDYRVTWIVVQGPAVPGITCPYRNALISVCQLN